MIIVELLPYLVLKYIIPESVTAECRNARNAGAARRLCRYTPALSGVLRFQVNQSSNPEAIGVPGK
jgi:hypothetical protein